MPTRREKNEKLQALLADPVNFEQLCEDIAEGHTLYSVAQSWGVRYGKLYAWIHDQEHPDRLEAYVKALESRTSYNHDIVVKGIGDVIGVDIRRAYGQDGKLLPAHEIPDDVAVALQSMDVSEDKDGTINKKARVSDRVQALTLMGRHLKMFTDKSEVSGSISLEDAVKASMPPPKAKTPADAA